MTTSATKKLEKFAKIKKITNNQLATDKSFTKLSIDKIKSNFLESQEFRQWVSSVNKAYKQNVEEGEVAIVTTLTTHYGDKALANLLNEAKGVASTNTVAERLANVQLTKWLTEEKSVDNVFNLLKLDETGGNLFKSSLFSSWASYANTFQQNPEDAMFSTLTTHFDDTTVANMLLTAKEDSSIAFKLEKVELEH